MFDLSTVPSIFYWEVLAGVIVVLAGAGGKAVKDAVKEYQAGKNNQEHQTDLVNTWALGRPATDTEPAIPSFIRDTWPAHADLLTQVAETVEREWTHNSGTSSKDVLFEILKLLGGKVPPSSEGAAPSEGENADASK